MKLFGRLLLIVTLAAASSAQNPHQKIYETERAFERAVAEKGIRDGFIQYLSPTGVMFMPDAVNGRETWRARAASPALLTWNPVRIDVSANGALAYSVGNSRFRPTGKDDPQINYGHYISVWTRQPDGEYRAALDTGINHEKPLAEPKDWKSPLGGHDANPDKLSAADFAVGFYQTVQDGGAVKAYKRYLADDAIIMRDGKFPAFDRKTAMELVKGKPRINFAKRKSFTEAADLAYVNAPYNVLDKSGKETERGNFVQVWKLRNCKWQIVADVLVPVPAKDEPSDN